MMDKAKGRSTIYSLILRQNLPTRLVGIVLKCLEADRHKRYTSAKQLHDDLEEYERTPPGELLDRLLRAQTHPADPRHVDRGLVVAGLDQPAELRRPGHVGPLADHHEPGVRPDLERLQPGEPGGVISRYDGPRRQTLDRLGDLGDMGRRRTAAAADDVHQAGLGELPDHPGRLHRLLVVPAEGVRKTGVRVGGDVGVGEAGQVDHVRTHLAGAE